VEDPAQDLTPELQHIADAYLAHFDKRDIVAPSESWLVDADRWVRALKDPKNESPSGLPQQTGLERGAPMSTASEGLPRLVALKNRSPRFSATRR
jgi:hypothetical protein